MMKSPPVDEVIVADRSSNAARRELLNPHGQLRGYSRGRRTGIVPPTRGT
jgi:hypothetical protein